jgi:hypothetical protein
MARNVLWSDILGGEQPRSTEIAGSTLAGGLGTAKRGSDRRLRERNPVGVQQNVGRDQTVQHGSGRAGAEICQRAGMAKLTALAEHGHRRQELARGRVDVGARQRPIGERFRCEILDRAGEGLIAALDQHLGEDVDHERVATAGWVDLLSHLVTHEGGPALREEPLGPGGAERAQPATCGRCVTCKVSEQRRPLETGRPGRQNECYRLVGNSFRQVQESLEAGLVGEVRVVDKQDERGCPGHVEAHPIQTTKVVQRRNTCRALGERWAALAREGSRRDVAGPAQGRFDKLDDHAVLELALTPPAPRRHDLHAALERERLDRGDQRRLAESAGTLHEQDRATPCSSRPEHPRGETPGVAAFD